MGISQLPLLSYSLILVFLERVSGQLLVVIIPKIYWSSQSKIVYTVFLMGSYLMLPRSRDDFLSLIEKGLKTHRPYIVRGMAIKAAVCIDVVGKLNKN